MKILVVDDDTKYLGLLSSLLRDRGHEVFMAEEGKQARELLDVEQVDLIISDVVMPTLDGVWFHSYVREFSNVPDVPFVFVSGHDDDHTRNLVINPSLDLSLSKMLPPEKLMKRIEGFTKRSVVETIRLKK
jgi:DNA-binding response OmpR family regulator